MSQHAVIRLDGLEIPLIGIPTSAVREVCDACGEIFHMSDMLIVDTGLYCEACAEEKIDA